MKKKRKRKKINNKIINKIIVNKKIMNKHNLIQNNQIIKIILKIMNKIHKIQIMENIMNKIHKMSNKNNNRTIIFKNRRIIKIKSLQMMTCDIVKFIVINLQYDIFNLYHSSFGAAFSYKTFEYEHFSNA